MLVLQIRKEGKVIPPVDLYEKTGLDIDIQPVVVTGGKYLLPDGVYRKEHKTSIDIRRDINAEDFELLSPEDRWQHCIEHIERPWYFIESYMNEVSSRKGNGSYYFRQLKVKLTSLLAGKGVKLIETDRRFSRVGVIPRTPSFYLFHSMTITFENGKFNDMWSGPFNKPWDSYFYMGEHDG